VADSAPAAPDTTTPPPEQIPATIRPWVEPYLSEVAHTLATGGPGGGSSGSSGSSGGGGALAGSAGSSGSACPCGSGSGTAAGSGDLRGLTNVGGSVGPVIDTTQGAPGEQAEVAISADPARPGHLFLEANDSDRGGGLRGVFIAQSSDNGRTWVNGHRIGDGSDEFPVTAGDPSVAFDKYGNLFMTYIDKNTGSLGGVDVLLSTDDGNRFTLLTTVAGTNPSAGIDQPTVVTGPNTDGIHSSFWVSFNDFGGTNRQAVFGAPVFGLGRVGPVSRLFDVPNSTNGNFGDIVVGPRGQVMVAFQDQRSRTGPDTISTSIKTDGFGPGPFSRGTVATTTNIGGFLPIIAQPHRTIDAEAGLAWDHSGGPNTGRLYLMYTDAPSVAQNRTITNIMVRHSDDGGATWSPPAMVNDVTGHLSFLPRIALDQTTGQVGVSWYDTRNDLGQGGPNDLDGRPNDEPEFYAAFSASGGRCFGPNIQVSFTASSAIRNTDGGFDFGDYTGATFDHGVYHAAWADNTDNVNDFGIASSAIVPPRLQAPQDTSDPDETSDRAHNLGVVTPGHPGTENNLTISTLTNGLPDYDWFRWTMGAAGTFTINFNVVQASGNLEVHVFTIGRNNTLVELTTVSTVTAQTCNSVQPVSISAHAGEPILAEVKGTNSALGIHDVGLYNLGFNLA
jgi:hypothetical protein